MPTTEQNVVNFINTNNLIGIKAGSARETFLNIWMVVVDERIFARSWGFSERSWFNTFLEEARGQLKCGDIIADIRAEVPVWNESLNERINQAYLAKYDEGDNSFYAKGITQPEHVAKTMEFILL